MKIDFDPSKSGKNARERGLPFDLAADLAWTTALIDEDIRNTYPERRYQGDWDGGGSYACCGLHTDSRGVFG
jgi:uncharacterized DUF497 family protein